MKVKIKKLHPDAIIPKYQTSGSAGFDLHSIEDVLIAGLTQQVIKTGLAYEVPQGYELQIRPRSGLAAKHRIMVTNSPGTLDSDYRGELCVILSNFGGDYTIRKGDRIAQGVISPVYQASFEEASELSETQRGTGGFGSTDKT